MQVLRQGDSETIFTQTIEKLDNGITRINVIETKMHVGKHTIDGHYWIERDGVMSDQSSMIRFIKESSGWASCPDPNKFIVFEYINAEMEKKIIDKEVKRQQQEWGGEAEWERKIMALVSQRSEYGNDCFTRSSYELLTGGGVRRFGIVGVACPKMRRVYWFYGHPDNSTYEDFIVPNGDMRGIKHTRETPFTPRISGLWDSIRTKNTHVAPRIIKNEKEEQAKADKALAELLAMLDNEDTKKNKSNKKK